MDVGYGSVLIDSFRVGFGRFCDVCNVGIEDVDNDF